MAAIATPTFTAEELLALVAMLGDDVKQQFVAALVGDDDPTPAKGATRKTGKTGKAGKAGRTTSAAPKAAVAHRTVSLATAAKKVAEGADAWKVFVKSSNTGLPIPYGKVLRAIRAQERADKAEAEAKTGTKTRKGTKTAKPAKPATRPGKASATKGNPYFSMSKADLLADGSKGAKAEIARRKAKRASK